MIFNFFFLKKAMCTILRFICYKHISKEVLWKINQKLCPLEEVTYKKSLKIISFQFTKRVREIYRKGCNSKAISSRVLKSPTKIVEIKTCISNDPALLGSDPLAHSRPSSSSGLERYQCLIYPPAHEPFSSLSHQTCMCVYTVCR